MGKQTRTKGRGRREKRKQITIYWRERQRPSAIVWSCPPEMLVISHLLLCFLFFIALIYLFLNDSIFLWFENQEKYKTLHIEILPPIPLPTQPMSLLLCPGKPSFFLLYVSFQSLCKGTYTQENTGLDSYFAIRFFSFLFLSF